MKGWLQRKLGLKRLGRLMWADQLPHCAPMVHPYTMEQVVKVESGGDPLSVNVNKLPAKLQPRPPRTTEEAIATAHAWISKGYSVDMGLTQLNSANLPKLNLTVEQVLGTSDATICTNLAAGSSILASGYHDASSRFGPGQYALKIALSIYNTGTIDRGFANGYVAKYYAIPSITLVNPPRIIQTRMTRREFYANKDW